MRLILLSAALLLGACATTPPTVPNESADQRGIAMITLVDRAVVHAFRTESEFASFDNQYPLTWNVSDMLVEATGAAAAVEIAVKNTPQWLASQQNTVSRTDSGSYVLNRTTAGQIGRYCIAQNVGSLIIWLDDNQRRTVQGGQYALTGNGALEIESPGVNPFIAYSSVLGIGVDCRSGRITAAARDASLLRISNFRPPPGGLPQLELDKTRSYFEQQSQQLAKDLLSQMGLER